MSTSLKVICTIVIVLLLSFIGPLSGNTKTPPLFWMIGVTIFYAIWRNTPKKKDISNVPSDSIGVTSQIATTANKKASTKTKWWVDLLVIIGFLILGVLIAFLIRN